MIDLTKLSTADTGRWVWYKPNYGAWEKGRFKTWNEAYVFVVYGANALRNDWLLQGSQATHPDDLHWIEHVEPCAADKGFRCTCPALQVSEGIPVP